MNARATSSSGYRMRPAPRRRVGGAPQSRIRWDRAGRIALVLALAFVALSYVHPMLNLLDGWKEARSQSSRLQRLEAENVELSAHAKSLKDSEGVRRAARAAGLIAPGERPYVIHGLAAE